jgi:hypothetical protein
VFLLETKGSTGTPPFKMSFTYFFTSYLVSGLTAGLTGSFFGELTIGLSTELALYVVAVFLNPLVGFF